MIYVPEETTVDDNGNDNHGNHADHDEGDQTTRRALLLLRSLHAVLIRFPVLVQCFQHCMKTNCKERVVSQYFGKSYVTSYVIFIDHI